jgi:hypothetical protein
MLRAETFRMNNDILDAERNEEGKKSKHGKIPQSTNFQLNNFKIDSITFTIKGLN